MVSSPSMGRAAKKLHLLTLAQWGDLDEDEEGELVDGVLEEEERRLGCTS
jgi:hypothetical protein